MTNLKEQARAFIEQTSPNCDYLYASEVADFTEQQLAEPIDMILHCPKCHKQHIDKPEPDVCVCGHERVNHYTGLGDEDDGCPDCRWQIDRSQACTGFKVAWNNPPHHKHLCRTEDGGCGHLWTPSLRNTNGVEALKEQT